MDRAKTIATWIVSVLLFALFTVGSGLPKVLARADMVENFEHFGYPQWFRSFTGILEVGCGVSLLVPRVAPYAATLLVCTMVGAAYSHLRVDESPVIPLVVLGLLAAVGWARRPAFLRGGAPAAEPAGD